MIRVLIVDDSSFFRKRLIEIVNNDPDLELAGEAQNGKEAVRLVKELRPDVVTMDVEMPVLNGIDAVRQIMQVAPTPVLMFSSLTREGAQSTLDALDAGAMDFMPKNFDDIARRKEEVIGSITNKIKELGRASRYGAFASAKKAFVEHSQSAGSRSSLHSSQATTSFTSRFGASTSSSSLNKSYQKDTTSSFARPSILGSSATSTDNKTSTSGPTLRTEPLNKTLPGAMNAPVSFAGRTNNYQLLAIGSSTGGPVALQTVLTGIPANFPLPILVIQHMPEAFTGPFAKRLDQLCHLRVVEAKEGDLILPGTIYVAPGARQMLVAEGNGKKPYLHIIPSPENLNYRPSVDITFGTAAKVYGSKVLAIVLTGMGHDGEKGSGMLKSSGSVVWAQNEQTCVIYGMPKAVIDAGHASKILPINEFSQEIIQEVSK